MTQKQDLLFNELAIGFRNIIDDILKSKYFKCKKLFYGCEVFYCGKDVIKFLNDITNIKDIPKILDQCISDKYTISDLQKKFLFLGSKHNKKNIIDPNQDFIHTLNRYEQKDIYINNKALYKLIGFSKKEIAKPFQDFIYNVVLPSLDNKHQELFALLGVSKNPRVKPFQDFIYDQLLPSLDYKYDQLTNLKK